MKKIEELRNYLLENYVSEDGDLILSGLDFSDFNGDVYIGYMKVQGDLFQYNHEVEGNLYQGVQDVQGNLYQSNNEAQGDLYNNNNKYGGELFETPSTKLLKEVTLKELAKLDYTLKENKQ